LVAKKLDTRKVKTSRGKKREKPTKTQTFLENVDQDKRYAKTRRKKGDKVLNRYFGVEGTALGKYATLGVKKDAAHRGGGKGQGKRRGMEKEKKKNPSLRKRYQSRDEDHLHIV